MDEWSEIPLEDLPTWMRRARQGIDWGILIIIGACLLLAWPFFLQDGLPHTNDSENHVYMGADYALALREGRLYPRWSATVLGGHGAPIPHYYPPGTPYTVALVDLFFTDDPVVAVRVIYVVAFCLAGATTYAFVMRWAGSRVAILVSILYVYSPYFGLTAPHILGDLPGVVALALLPSMLWGANRLLLLNRTSDFLITALIGCGLILTDVKIAIVTSCLVLGLIIRHIAVKNKRRPPAFVLLSGVFSIGLASFFWLPALLERDAVQWKILAEARFQLTLDPIDLIIPLQRIDLDDLLPLPQLTIGIGGLIFSLLGVVGIVLNKDNRSMYMLFLVSAVIIAGVGLVLLPDEIWLLGPLMFCLSIVGGASLSLVDHSLMHPTITKRFSLPLFLVFVLVLALPVWMAPRWPQSFGATGPSAQIEYEQWDYGIAVLPPGRAVPVTLVDTSHFDQELIRAYQSGDDARPLLDQSVNNGQISPIGNSSHHDQYFVNAVDEIIFASQRANFPGWQATLENTVLDVEIQESTGLIQLTIPEARSGNLELVLNSTSIRRVSWAITWTLLFVLSASVLSLRYLQQDRAINDYLRYISFDEARWLWGVLAGFLIVIFLFATPDSPYTLHAKPSRGISGSTAISSRTSVGLELLTYTLDKTEYQIGQSLDISLIWLASRIMRKNYIVQLHLQDVNAPLIRRIETLPRHPGRYPTRRWMPNLYVRDDYTILLPADIPPGMYQVAIEVYDCEDKCLPEDRLNFFGSNTPFVGLVLTIPEVISITS